MTHPGLLCWLMVAAGPVPPASIPDGVVVGQRFAQRFSDGAGLAALNASDGRQLWFELPTSFREDEVLPGVHAALPEVDEILASPDGRWLAVVSSDEGHPRLEVVDLPLLLDWRRWLVAVSIDPSPGSLRVVSWQGAELLVASGYALDGCLADCTNLGPGALGDERGFLLDPVTRSLRALDQRKASPLIALADED